MSNLPPRLALQVVIARTRSNVTPEEYVDSLGTTAGLSFPLTQRQISKKPHMAALMRAAVNAGVPVRWQEPAR